MQDREARRRAALASPGNSRHRAAGDDRLDEWSVAAAWAWPVERRPPPLVQALREPPSPATAQRVTQSRPPPKIRRKNRNTFSASRKIDAAISGAEAMSFDRRSRWKSPIVSAAKITSPMIA